MRPGARQHWKGLHRHFRVSYADSRRYQQSCREHDAELDHETACPSTK